MEDKTVNSVKSKKTQSSRDSRKHEYRTGTEKQQISCGKCGYDHVKQQCPAYGKRCNRCKRLNHFQKMCKTKITTNLKSRKKRVNTVEDSSESDSDYDLYAGIIHDLPLNSVNPLNDEWSVNSEINGKQINFQIDTGAKCNIMSQTVFQSFGLTTVMKITGTKLTSFSGHKLKPVGIVQLPCKIQGNIFNIDFYIVNSSVPSVLGASTCRDIGLIQRLYRIYSNETPKKQKDLSQDIQENYTDCFEGLDCMPDTYSITRGP